MVVIWSLTDLCLEYARLDLVFTTTFPTLEFKLAPDSSALKICEALSISPVSLRRLFYNKKNLSITVRLFIRDCPLSKLSGFLKVISGCLFQNPYHHFQVGPDVELNLDFCELFLKIAQAKALMCATERG